MHVFTTPPAEKPGAAVSGRPKADTAVLELAMSDQILMIQGDAVWLVDNTSMTFEQIADSAGLHPLKVKRRRARWRGGARHPRRRPDQQRAADARWN